jgi:hypothetical protein
MSDKPRAYSVYADDPMYVALVKRIDEQRAEIERLQQQRVEMMLRIERLRINLRDYRAKHPCSHAVMCWADEIASKAPGRATP